MLLLVAVAVVASAGVGLTLTQRSLVQVTGQRTATGRAVLHVDDLLASYVDQETGLRGYLLSADSRFLAPTTTAGQALAGQAALVRADASLPSAPPTAARSLDTVFALHERWTRKVYEPETTDVAAGRLEQARLTEAGGAGKALLDQIRVELTGLHDHYVAARDALADRQSALERRLGQIGLLSLAALMSMLVVVAVTAERTIAGPLTVLRRRVRAVAAGRHTAPLPQAQGPAEVRGVAADVERMRARLVDQMAEQRRLITALEQDGPAAVAVRAALDATSVLQHDRPGLTVAGRLVPAEGVLAGDWFDVVDLTDGRTALVIGDVTGHGARAGVFALRLKHVLRTALQLSGHPGTALSAAATAIADAPDDHDVAAGALFATAAIAVIDTQRGIVTHANAGHCYGLLLDNSPAKPTHNPDTHSGDMPVDEPHDPYRPVLLGPTGPLLTGITASHHWHIETHAFPPGSALALVTDGLLEARPPGGHDTYGDDRLHANITRHLAESSRRCDGIGSLHDHADPAVMTTLIDTAEIDVLPSVAPRRRLNDVVDVVLEDVADHATPTDDCTLVIARHHPSSKTGSENPERFGVRRFRWQARPRQRAAISLAVDTSQVPQ